MAGPVVVVVTYVPAQEVVLVLTVVVGERVDHHTPQVELCWTDSEGVIAGARRRFRST
jgi:hypothetical protein